MRASRPKTTFGALLAFVAACAAPVSQDPTTTPTSQVSAGPSTTRRLVVGCADEAGFREGGEVAVFEDPGSDSDTVGLVSWDARDACETFTIAFETPEGAPATTPPSIDIRYLEGVPILRVRLSTTATVITDQLVETPLVDRLFVVRALDGGMFVDFHLAAPAQTHASVRTSPARLVLDFQPGIVTYPRRAVIGDRVVVSTPANESVVPTEFEVSGYSRILESNVVLIGTSGDQVVVQAQTQAAESVATWGEFRERVFSPAGSLTLFVGEESAEDGSLQGVTVNLTVQ